MDEAVPISDVALRSEVGGGLVGREERQRTQRLENLVALRMKLGLKCFDIVGRRNVGESQIT